MPQITYIEYNGTAHSVQVANGDSVMQGAVDNMIDGIVGECGGACACATCHCYVDDAWIDQVGKPETDEQLMLTFSPNEVRSNSRLGCQITVTDELDGLVVNLPESQF